MRGDPPFERSKLSSSKWSTPHARGSTLTDLLKTQILVVYPACAGIHPFSSSVLSISGSLPRMRGDPPLEPIAVLL